jgi:hypothetical protein
LIVKKGAGKMPSLALSAGRGIAVLKELRLGVPAFHVGATSMCCVSRFELLSM